MPLVNKAWHAGYYFSPMSTHQAKYRLELFGYKMSPLDFYILLK